LAASGGERLKVMSALGHEQTSRNVRVMSVIPLNADIHQPGLHVRFMPEADISAARQLSQLVPSADIDGGRRLTRHANNTSSRVTYSHKLNSALFGDCFIRLVDRGDLLCRYEDELLRHATHH
jgi:hypothetical protein